MSSLLAEPLTRFFVQIVVIIAACRGLGLLARRLGQPVVIAEIAAGIVLGPSLLGWAAPDAFGTLFPPGSLGTVRAVSQLGLLLFMFLVGLELDLRHLRGRARASILIAHGGIAVPFALGYGLAFWIERDHLPPGASFTAFALFMGVAMSTTAFPVLARILSEQRLLRTRVGAIAIASAAIADLFAWCLLAFAVSYARPHDLVGPVATTVLTLLYVAVMLLVVRPVLARLAARASTPGAMSQNLVALVLLLVIVSSLVTERIGIHLLFGAFLLGVVLPKDGGFARAVAEKLEDMIVVFLLPLFFAVSGLRTELALLDTPRDLLVCGVIVAVASLGKFGGGAVAARMGGASWREAGAIGVLMNTRGLMELVVLNIGLDLGIISPSLFSMMVIMALATTVVTTPLLRWIYPPAVMARDLLSAEAEPVTRRAPVQRVLACISHGPAGPGLVSMAHSLAGPAGEVTALHLASPADRASARVGDAVDAVPAELTLALARAGELGIAVRTLSFVSTAPAEDIANVADVRDADVTLLGLHKPILSQSLLGGVVHEVMHRTDSTVAVYMERGPSGPTRVLVPFQGSPHDRAALALAARIQQSRGSEVVVLHVIAAGETPAAGRIQTDTFAETGGVVTVETVEHRSPAEAALARATAFDLLVVGVGASWGLGERRLGFGLQSERLIRDCPTSLLVVRGPRAASPSRPASE